MSNPLDKPHDSLGQFKKKHGFSYTCLNHPIYYIWTSLRQRCNNPLHRAYPSYGGRNIKCCKEWDDFEVFLADMGPTWKPGLTIERKNNNLGYSKENCIWETRKTQARNRRNSHTLTFNGQTKTISEWSELMHWGWHVISERLKRGWSVEKIMTTPLQKP